jgi:uncharacterized protein YbjT (DUF2867 family)
MNDFEAERTLEPLLPGRVLLLGAGGFIGSAVLARLVADGTRVRAVVRRAAQAIELAGVEWRVLDLKRLVDPEDWLPHLEAIDAVVNCAGVLQGGDDLLAVHVDSARALYSACERTGVRRVVHVSAVGAERAAVSEFSATKRLGEEALMATALDWVVLRPSVVVGRAAYGGTALLRGLAALPVTPVFPDAGPLQVVQLDELVATVVALARRGAPARIALDVVGPERLPFGDVVATLRAWLRLPPAPRWRVPRVLAALGYRLGDFVRVLGWRVAVGSVARRELVRGAVGDPAAWQTLMGLQPTSLADALAREPASVQEWRFARLYFLKPLVFAVFSLFWIGTGLISLGPGWEQGVGYLRAGGVSDGLAQAGVVAGALADLGIGVGIAFRRSSRGALFAALAVSVFYMVAGTFVLPQLWLDPVGPMLKIWPIMALNLVALALLDDR